MTKAKIIKIRTVCWKMLEKYYEYSNMRSLVQSPVISKDKLPYTVIPNQQFYDSSMFNG